MKIVNCILFMALSLTAAAQTPESKGYTLLFEENFSGDTLNTQMWRYRIDRRYGMGYMNGVNRAENVRVKDGILYIDCRQEMIDGKLENTGGGIISKKNFGYGYYECLSKPFMAGSGVHTSFWQRGGATPNNDVFEIDSYEIDSKYNIATNNLYMVLADKTHGGVAWPHRAQIPFETDEDGWFLDAYEYTPDGIIFYDNGKEVARADWKELNAAQAVWLTALNGVGKVEADKQPCSSLFKYFRYYAKDYPGVNILSNGNFEFNQDRVNPSKPIAWTPVGTEDALMLKKDDAFRDDYKLCIGTDSKPFCIALRQCLSFIMDGDYVLSAMVRSSGGLHRARIVASPTVNMYADAVSADIPKSGEWTRISVPVKVKNHEIYISIDAAGEAGKWIEIDDVTFMKPVQKNAKAPEPVPFSLYSDAVWKIAEKQPINFPGDERFYFFSRNSGLGDTISVCFTVNASEKANMMPIARIPKTGNSGWAVQLTKSGGLIFRIGSVENHTDVVAKNVYKPGQPVRISCVFENGTALIYVNGKLAKRERGIEQDTKDKTAAGRMGTVGRAYEAVGDVVMKVDKDDSEDETMRNFRGQLSNVAIYNHSVIR